MEDGISNVTFLKHPHYFSLKWFDYFAAHALIPPLPLPSFPVLFLLFEVIWDFSTVEEQPTLFCLLKAQVLLVAVVTLPTNSKDHTL